MQFNKKDIEERLIRSKIQRRIELVQDGLEDIWMFLYLGSGAYFSCDEEFLAELIDFRLEIEVRSQDLYLDYQTKFLDDLLQFKPVEFDTALVDIVSWFDDMPIEIPRHLNDLAENDTKIYRRVVTENIESEFIIVDGESTRIFLKLVT